MLRIPFMSEILIYFCLGQEQPLSKVNCQKWLLRRYVLWEFVTQPIRFCYLQLVKQLTSVAGCDGLDDGSVD